MPSILARKPWTKCCRACSPSVTMSTPASSCSFTASMVASRLARSSSAPEDFQGAHSTLGSASHSGFGSEPAIVVGNSILDVSSGIFDLRAYVPCLEGGVQRPSLRGAQRRSDPVLCLPLDCFASLAMTGLLLAVLI